MSAAAAKAVPESKPEIQSALDNIDPQQIQTFVETFWENYNNELFFFCKHLIWSLVIVLLMMLVVKLISSFIRKMAAKAQWCDDSTERIMRQIVKYVASFLALIIILELFGVNTASLLTVLGAAGLAVGLALKDTLSNLAAGIVLLFTHPYKQGDYIECGSVSGTITRMGLFTSTLDTADGLFVSVPNTVLWGSAIKNYSRNDIRRVDIVVGVSYSDNIEKGVEVLLALMNGDSRIVKTPAPEVLIAELADSSVNLQLRYWVAPADYWDVYWSMKGQLKNTLEGAGLNIPFPQRVVTFTNTNALGNQQ